MADLGTISSLPAGSVLNERYEIKRLIGQGGMGIVYLAVDRQLDEAPRAIKTIRPDLLADPRGIKQLRAEALAAQTLSHPNIVRVYHYEQWEGISYLVMEYIVGRTLAEILSEKEKLSEREFFAIAGQLCEGLAYAHQQGVIHQDIKPSNIFVEPGGGVKLADFGIARATKDITTRMTGQIPSGTLIYTSPEVLRGEKPTPASDIYSLGIVFYEVLSGDPPFVRGDIFRQHQEYEPKPIGGVSGGLFAALKTGLEKEPGRRPADAKRYLGAISGEAAPPAYQAGEKAACCEVTEYQPSADRRPQDDVENRRRLRAEGKGWLTTLMLCLFCGIFGAHRFYTGHTRIATIQLVTFGGLGIWWLVDMILILTDSFRHADGSVLVKW